MNGKKEINLKRSQVRKKLFFSNFKITIGKYYPIEIDYSGEDNIEKLNLNKNSKLSPPLQRLIALIFDVDMMVNSLLQFLDTKVGEDIV